MKLVFFQKGITELVSVIKLLSVESLFLMLIYCAQTTTVGNLVN